MKCVMQACEGRSVCGIQTMHVVRKYIQGIRHYTFIITLCAFSLPGWNKTIANIRPHSSSFLFKSINLFCPHTCPHGAGSPGEVGLDHVSSLNSNELITADE